VRDDRSSPRECAAALQLHDAIRVHQRTTTNTWWMDDMYTGGVRAGGAIEISACWVGVRCDRHHGEALGVHHGPPRLGDGEGDNSRRCMDSMIE